MLPRDVQGLTIAPETVSISGWAPFIELKLVPEAPERDPERCLSPLERGAAALARAGAVLRRAA